MKLEGGVSEGRDLLLWRENNPRILDCVFDVVRFQMLKIQLQPSISQRVSRLNVVAQGGRPFVCAAQAKCHPTGYVLADCTFGTGGRPCFIISYPRRRGIFRNLDLSFAPPE